jgi:uncharacterized membrane protein
VLETAGDTVPLDPTLAASDETGGDHRDDGDIGGDADSGLTDAELLEAELTRLTGPGAGPEPVPPRRVGWLFTVLGLAGLVASFALSVERVRQVANPNYVPSCSINSLLTCSPAMGSSQGALFGFPNAFIGLVAFPVVVVFGLALLARVELPRWMWTGMVVGASLGAVLVHFLIGTSLFALRALCPWCLLVWVSTIPIWWYAVVHVVSTRRAASWLVRNRLVVLITWFALLLALILVVLRDRIALVV